MPTAIENRIADDSSSAFSDFGLSPHLCHHRILAQRVLDTGFRDQKETLPPANPASFRLVCFCRAACRPGRSTSFKMPVSICSSVFQDAYKHEKLWVRTSLPLLFHGNGLYPRAWTYI